MITQEDKELLLKDLSARILYGVKVQINSDVKKVAGVKNGFVVTKERGLYSTKEYITRIECCRPYLRPMSSMTQEEEKEYINIDNRSYSCPMAYAHIPASDRIDWFLKNHFDFRGLIPMGLAVEVTEENNPYKTELV